MKCTFCGAEVPDGTSKCPVCGVPLGGENPFSSPNNASRPAAPASGGQVRCTACGAALPAGTRFCPQCGSRLSGPSDEEKGQRQEQKDSFWNDVETEAEKQRKIRRRSNLVGWLMRLLGLLAVAFLIYYIAS